MPDCPELQRVTTEYIAIEDRLRLSGATADEQTVVLWLTQRMLHRLVPQLTDWLERRGGSTVDDGALQEFAQHAAEAALTAQPAVEASSEAVWRVVTVDISKGTDGLTLVFKSEGEVPRASLALSTQALRQWLGIMRGQCVGGGWPTGVWPAWMEEVQNPSPRPAARALH